MALIYSCPGAFTSLQVYDDVAANGPSLLATFDALIRVSERETAEIHELEVEAQYADAARAFLLLENVLRLNIGSCFREFRINEPVKQRSSAGAELLIVRGDAIGYELDRGFIREVQANGQVQHHVELDTLDGPDLLTQIFNLSFGLPSYLKKGSVESAKPVSLVMDKVSTRSALLLMAEASRGPTYDEKLELEAIRDSVDDRYQVNLVERRGASGDVPVITYAINELSIEERIEGDDVGTRIFGFGAGAEGESFLPMSLADNWWLIKSIAGTIITLEDDVAIEPNQLNAFYVEADEGVPPTRTAVVDTIANDQIKVASASGFSVGRRLRFVEDSAGVELTYLESPSGIALFGPRVMTIDRSDIPFVVNWAFNGFLRNWRLGGRGRPWCIPKFNVLDDIPSNDPPVGNPPDNTGGTSEGGICTISRTQNTFLFSDAFGGGDTDDYLPGWFATQCVTFEADPGDPDPDPSAIFGNSFCFGGDQHSGAWRLQNGQAESQAVQGEIFPFGNAVKFGVGSYQTLVLQADLTSQGADLFLMAWAGTENWYMGGLYRSSAGNLIGRIFKMVQGSGIFSLCSADISDSLTSPHEVKFVVDRGLGQQKLYVDGSLVCSSSDSSITGLILPGFRQGTGIDWRQFFNVGPSSVDNYYAAGQGWGNRIRVFGLNSGDKVTVYGQTVQESGGGFILLDIGAASVPDTGPLVITDAADVELARWDLEAIAPGSEYELICP